MLYMYIYVLLHTTFIAKIASDIMVDLLPDAHITLYFEVLKSRGS